MDPCARARGEREFAPASSLSPRAKAPWGGSCWGLIPPGPTSVADLKVEPACPGRAAHTLRQAWLLGRRLRYRPTCSTGPTPTVVGVHARAAPEPRRIADALALACSCRLAKQRESWNWKTLSLRGSLALHCGPGTSGGKGPLAKQRIGGAWIGACQYRGVISTRFSGQAWYTPRPALLR